MRASFSVLVLLSLLVGCSNGATDTVPQGCAHGTSGDDCIPMDCVITPPSPDPQSCTTAADCKQPLGVCYLQDYCDDGPGYLYATYATPACEAGSCKWQASTSDGSACPSAMPTEGTPCDPGVACRDGSSSCEYTTTLACGTVGATATCEGGLWKIRSVCDCSGADQTSCEANEACEWRSPDCFDVTTAYCAATATTCGQPGCPSCGPVTNKDCASAASTCSRCGGGTDTMACVP